MFHLHNWGPWKEFEEAWQIFDRRTGKTTSYGRKGQKRQYLRCNYTKRRYFTS